MTLLLFLPLLLLLFFLCGFFFFFVFFFFYLCSFLSSVFGPGWQWPAHCSGRLGVAGGPWQAGCGRLAVAGWPETKKLYIVDLPPDRSFSSEQIVSKP